MNHQHNLDEGQEPWIVPPEVQVLLDLFAPLQFYQPMGGKLVDPRIRKGEHPQEMGPDYGSGGIEGYEQNENAGYSLGGIEESGEGSITQRSNKPLIRREKHKQKVQERLDNELFKLREKADKLEKSAGKRSMDFRVMTLQVAKLEANMRRRQGHHDGPLGDEVYGSTLGHELATTFAPFRYSYGAPVSSFAYLQMKLFYHKEDNQIPLELLPFPRIFKIGEVNQLIFRVCRGGKMEENVHPGLQKLNGIMGHWKSRKFDSLPVAQADNYLATKSMLDSLGGELELACAWILASRESTKGGTAIQKKMMYPGEVLDIAVMLISDRLTKALDRLDRAS